MSVHLQLVRAAEAPRRQRAAQRLSAYGSFTVRHAQRLLAVRIISHSQLRAVARALFEIGRRQP